MAIDLFTPVVPDDRLHPLFKALAHRSHEPARRMLADIAAKFLDKDGNFVKDFHTTGFEGRLWKLYLHAYLRSDGFTPDEKKAVPDYIAFKAARTLFIEAMTVNPTQAKAGDEAEATAGTLTGWDLFSHWMQHVYPIKFGSPLFSKMKKKYWEQEHVRGQPFILAVEDCWMSARSVDSSGGQSSTETIAAPWREKSLRASLTVFVGCSGCLCGFLPGLTSLIRCLRITSGQEVVAPWT